MGMTLAEKVWRDHVVSKGTDGAPDLLYIDLHLVEVTSDLEEAAVFGAAACPARAITVLIGLPSQASPGADP